jgi:endonuclease/exonuclease/phosphatase (EEP) superfamily protein YafD
VTSEKNPSPATPSELSKKRPRHSGWSSASFGLLVGVCGLIMARLGHLWVGFDVFSQFSMQFIFLALAMGFGLVMPRLKGLVGICLFILFIAVYGLWPHIVSAGPEQLHSAVPDGSVKLKLASFNSLYGNTNFTGIRDSVLQIDADVVTMVEFGVEKRSVLDQLRSVYPYQFDCFVTEHCDEAILSKYPLNNMSSRGMWAGPTFIQASLGPEFGNLTILGIHTTRFPHSRAQFTQVRELVKYLETVPTRLIVMGDFNSTPFSRINQTMTTGLGLQRLTNLPTWPATRGFAQLAIDHIFVSPDVIALSDERIGDNAGSDHFPISVTVAIPQH